MISLDSHEKAFIARAQELGHVLARCCDTMPDLYNDDDKYDNAVDFFAYSSGYHNGPQCKECASSWCVHCTDIEDIKPCGESAMFNKDDAKLMPFAQSAQATGEADILPRLVDLLQGRVRPEDED